MGKIETAKRDNNLYNLIKIDWHSPINFTNNYIEY